MHYPQNETNLVVELQDLSVRTANYATQLARAEQFWLKWILRILSQILSRERPRTIVTGLSAQKVAREGGLDFMILGKSDGTICFGV